MERRATRAAPDVEKACRRSKLKPGSKLPKLIGREPAVLANVLAERVATNLSVHVGGEVAVVGAVVIDDLRLLRHLSSVRVSLPASRASISRVPGVDLGGIGLVAD